MTARGEPGGGRIGGGSFSNSRQSFETPRISRPKNVQSCLLGWKGCWEQAGHKNVDNLASTSFVAISLSFTPMRCKQTKIQKRMPRPHHSTFCTSSGNTLSPFLGSPSLAPGLVCPSGNARVNAGSPVSVGAPNLGARKSSSATALPVTG